MLFLVLAKVKLVIPLYRLRNILTIAVLPWSSWFMCNHLARGLPTHWSPDSNGQLFNPIWSHGQFKYVFPLTCAINQHLHIIENTQYSMQHY